ncbi:MAG: ATP-binding protein [Planctomycetota bacterium]|jgi:anti-sigma regulatory factor (Ser/Thr protein kinase)
MVVPSRVTTRDLVRSLERKTGRSREELERLVDMLCLSVREYLEQGSEVELGDLFALAVHGGPELREDESGGFSAFAATEKSLTATPVGDLKLSLDRACQQAIYYVSRKTGDFESLLSDHFGRRGWPLVKVTSGAEVHARMERNPPAAIIFEGHVEGWKELVRELKCNPMTNWVPVVGIFPDAARDEPAEHLVVMPDEIIYEPFDFGEFVRTAATELAERVTTPQHDVMELHMQLPGTFRDRKQARAMLREVLFRCDLPETFNEEACAALGEAIDNAHRHGHRHIECCTIGVRMILDPRRLVLVIRDSGPGFDHAAAVAAARGSRVPVGAGVPGEPRSRRGEAVQGGIARMFTLVDRIDYNRDGNEVVLSKSRPKRPTV